MERAMLHPEAETPHVSAHRTVRVDADRTESER